jgi:PhnB protein
MKSVTTYLHFDGNCREAMTSYQESLGGELQIVPYPDASGSPSTDPGAKIMHSQLARGKAPLLMASDCGPGGTPNAGNNFSVTVDCDSVEEIERLFAALADEGQIRLPLGDMAWGARFGMLTDKFGVQWMFNYVVGQ